MLEHTTEFISGKIRGAGYFLIVVTILAGMVPVAAKSQQPLSQQPLRMVIQPFQTEQKTRELFKPLVDYVQSVTGQEIKLLTFPNFISYWSEMQKDDRYEIAFDAAHFVDYRDKNKDFTVLARQPGVISISLIVPEDSLVFDAEELIGKKIATLGPPSIAAARLSEMFDNPLRQPTIIEGDNSSTVMALLIDGKVDAAMLPTPVVSNRMSGDGGISMVTTTDTIPGLAISVSPAVSAEVREKLLKGLLESDKTPAGKKLLEATRLGPFEKASNADFNGYSKLLDIF